MTVCLTCLNVYGSTDENDNSSLGDATANVSHACEAPDSLNKLKLVFVANFNYAPNNPFADTMIEMDFTKKSYVFVELQRKRSFIGAYQYRKLAQNVGYLEGRDTIGAHILRYSITLVCQNALEGGYIFSQVSEGASFDINQNMGRYYIYP